MMDHPKTTGTPAQISDLGGVWRRDLIETPARRDSDSQVFWLQGKTLFGDLRVEPDGQVAFSGRLTQDSSVFSWNMDLMSFDPPEFPDAGRLEWHGSDLWEYGVHQDYTELWRSAGQIQSGDFAMWLSNDGGRLAARLKIGGFDFAQIGMSGSPATSAMIQGTCPRFGTINTVMGACPDLDSLIETTSDTIDPDRWRVIACETFS